MFSSCSCHILLLDTTELYHEDKFKLPAYSHIYSEDSYSRAEHKVDNNIPRFQQPPNFFFLSSFPE